MLEFRQGWLTTGSQEQSDCIYIVIRMVPKVSTVLGCVPDLLLNKVKLSSMRHELIDEEVRCQGIVAAVQVKLRDVSRIVS